MGGCASKPKEFDTTQPEAPPNESVSPQKAENTEEAKNSTSGDATSTNAAAEPSTEKTNEEAPLVDLSQPKEDEGEVSNVVTAEGAAPVVVPEPIPAPAAEAEAVAPAPPTTEEKPKESTLVADQVDVAAKQLAEVNLVEAAPKEEIAKEKEPAEPAAELKPKVEEVAAPAPAEIKPTTASPKAPAVSEDKKTTTAANDAPPVTV